MFIWSSYSGGDNYTFTRIRKTDKASITISGGRNMLVSGQILLRHRDNDFVINNVEFEGLDSFIKPEFHFASTIEFNDGMPYPDILSNKKSVKVKKNYTQIIRIILFIEKNAVTGKKPFIIKVSTDQGIFNIKWTLEVHSFTLKEPKDSFIGHEYFFSPMLYFADTQPNESTPFYPYNCFSDSWCELMKHYAVSMKKLRVNYIYLQALDLLKAAGSKRISWDKWELNFKYLDKLAEIFIRYGSVKKFSVAHIVNAVDGTTINYPDEKGEIQSAEHGTSLANLWASVFYGAIYDHFKEKGWLDLLSMHIQDEPHTSETWKWAREQVKKYMPGINCAEPLDEHQIATQLADCCDCFIPRIEILDKHLDFYHKMQENGKELWAYSCCYPEESWFLNKFIDQPHQYSRLIEWTCFLSGATGFLHWGYNQWRKGMFGLCKDARFKGDGFIVYPDTENNSVLDSVRGIETVEGFQEWEMLVEADKKHPEEVKRIVSSVTKGFENFNFDETGKVLEKAKTKLLKLLDE